MATLATKLLVKIVVAAGLACLAGVSATGAMEYCRIACHQG
jgi:hypothetical protein